MHQNCVQPKTADSLLQSSGIAGRTLNLRLPFLGQAERFQPKSIEPLEIGAFSTAGDNLIQD
jgi:hypothetical protein